MSIDDAEAARIAREIVEQAMSEARARMAGIPPWIWSRTLSEVGPCRMPDCGRTKLADLWGTEVCYHCDIDTAKPPKLRDVQ